MRALIITASLVAVVYSDACAETRVSVAGDLTHFHYREFDVEGSELNRETGFLPGVRLTLDAQRERLITRFDLTLHGGAVDYDGQTQQGTPHETTTDTLLVTGGAEIGGWFGKEPGNQAVFLRLARRYWERDIQAGNGVQGLYEEYRWTELGLGLRKVWGTGQSGSWTNELSVAALAITDGTIFVALSELDGSDWDDTTLSLGDEAGLRLRYTASKTRPAYTLRVEPYAEYWEFGRSNTKIVTSGGEPVMCSSFGFCTVTEPRSESRRIGLAVGLEF